MSAAAPVRYLAYGSNLHPLRLTARTPSARLLGSVALEGWRLVFHKRGQDGSGKCNLRSGEGRVQAAVYQLSADDLATLDAIEGVNRGYRRDTLSVDGFGSCQAYLAEQPYVDASVRPFCWYRDLVLEGCRFHGFPERYVAAVAAVRCEPDPNAERRREHEALLARLRA
ncbi:MAG: gamma-glutamylcyclotransferase family protein [Pseudomonadota bacterium]